MGASWFPSNTTQLRLEFVDEGVFAIARLYWERVPRVCEQLVRATPFETICCHAIYSGSEIVAVSSDLPRLALEIPTDSVEVGEVAYSFLTAVGHYGVERDFAEICWFYDVDARPAMFEGPENVCVFAKLTNAREFLDVSRRMRVEGAKRVRVEVWAVDEVVA